MPDSVPPDKIFTARPRPLTRTASLLEAVDLPGDEIPGDAGFPVRVPPGFVARMRSGDPADPLLRQVLPTADESRDVDGFGPDPVGELDSEIATGVLQKYAGRALLILTGACAIHCRYCFRRSYPYAGKSLSRREQDTALATIAADSSLREIILSGGDPLSLPNARLDELFAALARITHIQRLRIHTRIPVVSPERIDSRFVTLVGESRLPVIIVVHANHARELDERAEKCLRALRSAGAVLLNQSVMLKGINDSVDVIVKLSERLFEIGVMPYYLHQLDPVNGAAHFAVDDQRAIDLVDAAANSLPGYLVPKLVREIPGAAAKKLVHEKGKILFQIRRET